MYNVFCRRILVGGCGVEICRDITTKMGWAPYERIKLMDICGVLHAVSEKSGLSCERIASLTNIAASRLDLAAQDEPDLSLDELQRVVDVCGYKLLVRNGTESFVIRADKRACLREDGVLPSQAIEALFGITGKTFREVSDITGLHIGYFQQVARRQSIPKASVFMTIAEAAGCQVVVRRFGESYVLDSSGSSHSIVLEGSGIRSERQRVAGKKTHINDPKSKLAQRGFYSIASNSESSDEMSLEAHEAFRAYYSKMLRRPNGEEHSS